MQGSGGAGGASGWPIGFWRENMSVGMFLWSGPDWHLDAAGRHTLEAYPAENAIKPAEVHPYRRREVRI